MTDWRRDLLKIGIIPDDMPDQTSFVLFNLDELNDLIKDVVEKAIDDVEFDKLSYKIKRVVDEEGAHADVLKINGKYFKSSDVEAYSSSIEETNADDFKELIKSTKEFYEGD